MVWTRQDLSLSVPVSTVGVTSADIYDLLGTQPGEVVRVPGNLSPPPWPREKLPMLLALFGVNTRSFRSLVPSVYFSHT